MNIELKPGVKEYLIEQNEQDIYIEMDNKGGCCSGPVYVPEVRLGKPEYTKMYDSFSQGGITVYLPKAEIKDDVNDITIKVKSFLGKKTLAVNGILAFKKETFDKKKF